MRHCKIRSIGQARRRSVYKERFLEDDQYRGLLRSLPDELQPILVIAYHLPLKRQELMSLRCDQIDLPNKHLRLDRRAAKSDKAVVAPIFGDMSAWLDLMLTKCRTISPHGKHLFIDSRGNPIIEFRKPWNKACEISGVAGLLYRELQRTAVRNMVRSGFPGKLITDVAGLKTNTLLWRATPTDRQDILAAGRQMQRYFDQQQELKPLELVRRKPN